MSSEPSELEVALQHFQGTGSPLWYLIGWAGATVRSGMDTWRTQEERDRLLRGAMHILENCARLHNEWEQRDRAAKAAGPAVTPQDHAETDANTEALAACCDLCGRHLVWPEDAPRPDVGLLVVCYDCSHRCKEAIMVRNVAPALDAWPPTIVCQECLREVPATPSEALYDQECPGEMVCPECYEHLVIPTKGA